MNFFISRNYRPRPTDSKLTCRRYFCQKRALASRISSSSLSLSFFPPRFLRLSIPFSSYPALSLCNETFFRLHAPTLRFVSLLSIQVIVPNLMKVDSTFLCLTGALFCRYIVSGWARKWLYFQENFVCENDIGDSRIFVSTRLSYFFSV